MTRRMRACYRPPMRRVLFTPLLLIACSAGGGHTNAPLDAAPLDARSRADAADAAPPADASLKLTCACSDHDEDCEACFRHISACCSEGDETFGGRVDHIVANCRLDPRCAACCDECTARTCEQIRAAGDCPL